MHLKIINMYRILILLFISTVAIGQQVKVDLNQIDKSGNAAFDDSTLVIDAVNNRIGIGTSTPDALLTLNGGTLKSTTNGDKIEFYEDDVPETDAYFKVGNATGVANLFRPAFILKGNTQDGNYSNGLIFDAISDSLTQGPVVEFMSRANNTTVTNRPLFRFANYYSSTNGSALEILANGNVGIGTTSPGRKLDIVGDFSVFGTSSTNSKIIGETGSFTQLGILDYTDSVGIKMSVEDWRASLIFDVFGLKGGSLNQIGIGNDYPTIAIYKTDFDVNGTLYSKAGNFLIANPYNSKITLGSDYFPNTQVGIGLTDPSYPLDVNGDVNSEIKYIKLTKTTDPQLAQLSPINLTWETQQVYDTDVFTHTAGAASVTVDKAGVYMVISTVNAYSTGTLRSEILGRVITSNGIEEGSASFMYIRNTTGTEEGSLHIQTMVSLSAGDIIYVNINPFYIDPSAVTYIDGSRSELLIYRMGY